jgi:hypothetical protein
MYDDHLFTAYARSFEDIRAGLLWLLHGDKLVAMTAETAVIERPTGSRQTYYRRAVEPGALVLPWELAPCGSPWAIAHSRSNED